MTIKIKSQQNLTNLLLIFVLGISLLGLTACLPEGETGTVTPGQISATQPDFDTQPDPAPPPPVAEEPPVLPPAPDNSADGDGIVINNGDAHTPSYSLHLQISKFEALQMKLSLNANCEGGDFVEYSTTANLQLTENQSNRRVYVSAQFLDYDGYPSSCFVDEILHDNKGPDILFQKYPLQSINEGERTELIYDVTDQASDVASVECRLNGVARPCSAGRTIVQIPGAAAGTYTFEITAVDSLGFSSRSAIQWDVTAVTRSIIHDINISEYRKWDILFVIDNSGSMAYEQKNMAERTRNFLSVLRGLDWQIAITTTDPGTKPVGGDGKFLELTGRKGEFLLNSNMGEANAQKLLSDTLQRPEIGSGNEQGIRSTYRVVERSLTGGSTHAQFFRSGAHFAVVLISDEDESANTTKNDPQSLLNFISSTYSGQKNFLFNSIITIPGDTACRKTYGYAYGERYKIMSELTGGVIGSVCASDYASQVTGVAERIRSMAQAFTLNCVPVQERGVRIYRDGVLVTEPYVLDGVRLSFAQAILPGQYRLEYSCLKD